MTKFVDKTEEILNKVLDWVDKDNLDKDSNSLSFRDELSSIYDSSYTPAVKNLYTVSIVSEDEKLNSYLKCHATSVSFNGESLAFQRNSVTKLFYVDSDAYKLTDDLTITWREADDWRVRKYHEAWLACFYDREQDCYISYPYNGRSSSCLTRTIRITLPKTSSEGSFKGIKPSTHILELTGVIPTNVGDLNLAWGPSGSNISHTLSYKVENWKWIEE